MGDRGLFDPEVDTQEAFSYPPEERRISTQPYDLSVQTLVEQWNDELLQIPEIQREYIWDNGRASRLIESLLLNIPVPPLYFAETEEARFDVIDGHQRIKSIVRYLNNEFALNGLGVLTEHKRKRFHQLPEREQRYLMTRSLRVVIIAYDSHPSMKFEVFERLNTGGIALNAQELRNSIHRGTLNQLLKSVVLNSAFRECIGTKTPRARMVDQELALRFFALRAGLADYRPPLKRFLNNFMADNRNAPPDWIEAQRQVFERTMELIAQTLGTNAFRLIDEHGEPLRDERGKPFPRGVNRALFDAQSLAFSWVEELSSESATEVMRSIGLALADGNVRDSVQIATGDRKRLHARTMAMVSALEAAGIDVRAPISFDSDD
jgi:hypothetical protein